MRSAEAATAPAPSSLLRFTEMGAVEVYVTAVAAMMALLALALWIASQHTDRVALRLFSLRYALAAPAWLTVHPVALGAPGDVPLGSAFVGIGLTVLTLCALEQYVGRLTRHRTAVLVGAGVAAALLMPLALQVWPGDPRPLYVLLASGMGYGCSVAWRAARRERNAGHGLIAAAFGFYPLLVLGVLAFVPGLPSQEIGYFMALPLIVAGIAVLLASLIRFGHRLEAELVQRQAAEQAVRELNAGLENRVAERTAELRLIVDGLEGFTRNVSHDLRGPLAGLAGLVRVAREALARGDVAKAEELLAPVATQADRLAELVDELALLTRLQEQTPRRERRPMRAIVDEAVAQLALAPDTADMLQQVTLRVDELPAADVDAGLMRQVFVNLLGNALRFAARGAPEAPAKPSVHVGTATERGTVWFFVADSGPGFPPERAGELFRPFARMHGAGLSRNGIGLSIVRRVVEAHGGRVWAESRPGQGATFRFALDAVELGPA